MILGIGTDIISIDRIKKVYDEFGEKFLDRILSESEKIKLNQKKTIDHKLSYIAKRYAAKEACVKALGSGFREGINWKDIEIISDDLSKPSIVIHNRAKKRLEKFLVNENVKFEQIKFDLSLSDDPPFAVAFVIIST